MWEQGDLRKWRQCRVGQCSQAQKGKQLPIDTTTSVASVYRSPQGNSQRSLPPSDDLKPQPLVSYVTMALGHDEHKAFGTSQMICHPAWGLGRSTALNLLYSEN